MKKFIEKLDLPICSDIYTFEKPEKSIFFDIETTGFSSKTTILYLIGCIYFDASINSYFSMQWLLEDDSDEACLLSEFFDFATNFKYIITYNGLGFDIPYIKDKLSIYNMNYNFDSFIIKDIYKDINPIKKIFKLENIKQKSIENFLHINRNDIYNGGQLISVFLEYKKSKSIDLENLILLHNKEDIIGLYKIMNIMNYVAVFNGVIQLTNIEIIYVNNDIPKEVIIHSNLKYHIPVRVSFGNTNYYITLYDNVFKIKIPIYNGGLKFFYPNYKDYYYLPKEDCSIHKSVAFYVDKNYRTKANAANCYSKKTGRFLPQFHEIIKPFFKIDYNDKITYFELTTDVLSSPISLHNYIIDTINSLIKII